MNGTEKSVLDVPRIAKSACPFQSTRGFACIRQAPIS
jgi:hypothetical protein